MSLAHRTGKGTVLLTYDERIGARHPSSAPVPGEGGAGGSIALTPSTRLGVIGLGYVGLPLAVEFGKRRDVVGFDIDPGRIAALQAGEDATREVAGEDLRAAHGLRYATGIEALSGCRVYIVTVPTPVDARKRPDLGPLLRASETVGRVLKRGDVVVYESTVFPGATEEECVPVLERVSGLKFNRDFFVGYSPERVNPGDPTRRLTMIRKVVAGSTPEAADFIDALYSEIITAGTYRAESIRVAEAAKVIENTQRDLNIALINELAIIFNRLGLDTEAVLEAAGTKWNFLPFRPGLVGGHCIGVDPYYLTAKAEETGYHPEIILAGRRLNDRMGEYVATSLVRAMLKRSIAVNGARVLVMGLTFKENCPDLRNTKVVDVVRELEEYGIRVDVHDPLADPDEAAQLYGIRLVSEPEAGIYDGVVVAVAHAAIRAMGAERIRAFGRDVHVLYDLKYAFPRDEVDIRL
jgi:UDP-N-acetyl-D-glucosamine/UDP-N-acetyl-D-galactosamine dehydrogenase